MLLLVTFFTQLRTKKHRKIDFFLPMYYNKKSEGAFRVLFAFFVWSGYAPGNRVLFPRGRRRERMVVRKE